MKAFPKMLGYIGIGKATGGDYGRILMLAFEAKRKQFSKLRFIYYLGKDFSGCDFKALYTTIPK